MKNCGRGVGEVRWFREKMGKGWLGGVIRKGRHVGAWVLAAFMLSIREALINKARAFLTERVLCMILSLMEDSMEVIDICRKRGEG
ncbi:MULTISPECIES: hypothetical protein [unclassified Bartonella]|uniref:hypothetical protein n=1 Tax=unclassified Bartonella TaxID=2645622 RepID=UPI0035D0D57C